MAMPMDSAASSTDCTRALGRLLLPVIKLQSATSSKQLEQKLNYLWTTAHAMLATSPAIAHAAATTIKEMARRQHAVLPSAVLDYLCQQCGGLIAPSVSADVRVVSVDGKSPANRKLARMQQRERRYTNNGLPRKCERLQNVVEIHCRRCGFANVRHGATVVYKPQDKKIKVKRPKTKGIKRPMEGALAPAPKRVKPSEPSVIEEERTSQDPSPFALSTSVVHPPPPSPRSLFAKPASPPRKLLDAKKKKKKPTTTNASVQHVKSSLDTFLQNLTKK